MSTLLSIDPGIRGVGVALWAEGKLTAAAYVANTLKDGSGPRECATAAQAVIDWHFKSGKASPDMLAVEIPQIYQRGSGKTKGDPNNLLPVFGVDAALAALLPNAHIMYGVPHEWKGGTQKPKTTSESYVIEGRVRLRLSDNELATIVWPNNVKHTWDVTDAIGIGLYHLRRFERRRVFARE